MPGIGAALLKVARSALPKKVSHTVIQREIEATRKALAQLENDRASHRTTIGTAADRRRDDLLAGKTAEEIDAIMQGARLAEIELERLELIEIELLGRLDTLRDNARALMWEEIHGRHREAFGAYLMAAQRVIEAYEEVLSVHAEASQGGFEVETRHAFCQLPTPHILMRENLFIMSREFDRLAGYQAPACPKPSPMDAAVKPIAHAKGGTPLYATVEGAHDRAVLFGATKPEPATTATAPAIPPAPRPQRRAPLLDGPPAEGEVAIVMIRSNVELTDRGQLIVGDRINVAADQAEGMLQTAAADYDHEPRATQPEGGE